MSTLEPHPKEFWEEKGDLSPPPKKKLLICNCPSRIKTKMICEYASDFWYNTLCTTLRPSFIHAYDIDTLAAYSSCFRKKIYIKKENFPVNIKNYVENFSALTFEV